MNIKIRIAVITIPKIIPPTNEAASNFLPLSVGAGVVCTAGAFVGVGVVVLAVEVDLVGDMCAAAVVLLGVTCAVVLGLINGAVITVVEFVAVAERKRESVICKFICKFIYIYIIIALKKNQTVQFGNQGWRPSKNMSCRILYLKFTETYFMNLKRPIIIIKILLITIIMINFLQNSWVLS